MTLRLIRLKISGFKSFADSGVLEIMPGLTGIIGPNGCGKSNISEALRWVMGERNARNLRGREMDDVIFAGTKVRPARNLAEVTLFFSHQPEETPGSSPPGLYSEASEIEVSRKIERGSGSTCRINGKEVRATDIQTFFADLSSGASASAIVGQNKISTLIAQKPEERSGLLEEAAGIGGLYSRRKEAQTHLDAARKNLALAADHLKQSEKFQNKLADQAQTAALYKDLSFRIYRTETEIFSAERMILFLLRKKSQTALAEFLTEKTALLQQKALYAPSPEKTAELADMRHKAFESKHSAGQKEKKLQEARQSLTRLQDESRSRLALLQEVRDFSLRVGKEEAELAACLAPLNRELQALNEQIKLLPEQIGQADQALNQIRQQKSQTEVLLRQALIGTELAKAEKNRQQAALKEATARFDRILQIFEQQSRQQAEALKKQPSPEILRLAEEKYNEAEKERQILNEELASLRQKLPFLTNESRLREKERQALLAELTALKAEAAGTERSLSALPTISGSDPTLLQEIILPAELTTAFGSIFGQDLFLSPEKNWQELPPLSPEFDPVFFQENCRLFKDLVKAPPVLTRALSVILLAPDDQTAVSLQPYLKEGQVLVTKEGRIRRWDGFFAAKEEEGQAAARHLQSLHSLQELQEKITALAPKVQTAETLWQKAEESLHQALTAEETLKTSLIRHEAFWTKEKNILTSLREQTEKNTLYLENMAAKLTETELSLKEAEQNLSRQKDLILPPEETTALSKKNAVLQEELSALEKAEKEARQTKEKLTLALSLSEQKRTSSIAQLQEIQARIDKNKADLQQFRHRSALLQGELQKLQQKITLTGPEIPALEALLRQEEKNTREAFAALREKEKTSADKEAAFAEITGRLQALREKEIAEEAEYRRFDAEIASLDLRIKEKCGSPDKLPDLTTRPEISQLSEEKCLAALRSLTRTLRQKNQTLNTERENIGPVNLMAESELSALQAEITRIKKEETELLQAIEAFQESITGLNQEGQKKTAEIFSKVSEHFQSFFRALFKGGEAKLKMIPTEDPLRSGLEIFVEPPGKKTVSLSLLSGGEQALSALALIFSVFLCCPSPVILLDEADAPLDDVNIGRFCTLLREVSRKTTAGILVITHHYLTMAHMDRLFGVTMQERGVSRILSVNLADSLTKEVSRP